MLNHSFTVTEPIEQTKAYRLSLLIGSYQWQFAPGGLIFRLHF